MTKADFIRIVEKKLKTLRNPKQRVALLCKESRRRLQRSNAASLALKKVK